MLTLTVKTDIAKVLKQFDTLSPRQYPFTVAKALTKTVKDAQAEIQRNLPSRFTLRRDWIVKGIRIKPATKADLEAIVYSRDAKFMARQEDGGDKKPMQSGGKYVAIPMPAVRRTKSQIISQSELPRNLQSSFIITAGDGRKYIAKRFAKGKRAGVQLLYELRPSTHINPRLGLKQDALRVIKAKLVQNLIDSVEFALKTAR